MLDLRKGRSSRRFSGGGTSNLREIQAALEQGLAHKLGGEEQVTKKKNGNSWARLLFITTEH